MVDAKFLVWVWRNELDSDDCRSFKIPNFSDTGKVCPFFVLKSIKHITSPFFEEFFVKVSEVRLSFDFSESFNLSMEKNDLHSQNCCVKVRQKKRRIFAEGKKLLDNPRRNWGKDRLFFLQKYPTMCKPFVKRNGLGKDFQAALSGILKCGYTAYSHYTRH